MGTHIFVFLVLVTVANFIVLGVKMAMEKSASD